MGTHDREARRAHAGYVGALRQLARAMTEFERVGVPLEPGPSGRIPPWTPEQHTVMVACAQAWDAVVTQRRAYDVAASEASHPETWPHA